MKDATSGWRIFHCVALLVTTLREYRVQIDQGLILPLVMILGMLFVFLTNEWITQATIELGPATVKNIDHVYNYAENIREQSSQLITKYNDIENATHYELQHLGVILGEPVQTELQGQFAPVFTKLKDFESHMDAILKNIEVTSGDVLKLKNKTRIFGRDLLKLRRDLLEDLNFEHCQANQFCLELTQLTEMVSVTANFSSMSTMDAEITELEAVIGESNLTKIITDGQNAIERIEQFIDSESQDQVNTLLDSNQTLESISTKLEAAITEVFELIDLQTNESIPLNNLRQAIDDFSHNKVHKIDRIRYNLNLTIGSFIAIILGFNVIGIFLGFCGYKREATPTNRTGASNLGGISLMLSIVTSFAFGWILMLATSGIFAIGGHAERYMCQTMQEDSQSGNFTGLQGISVYLIINSKV